MIRSIPTCTILNFMLHHEIMHAEHQFAVITTRAFFLHVDCLYDK